jgi:hypothetical protein
MARKSIKLPSSRSWAARTSSLLPLPTPRLSTTLSEALRPVARFLSLPSPRSPCRCPPPRSFPSARRSRAGACSNLRTLLVGIDAPDVGSYVGTPSECEETVRFVQAQGVKVMVETFPLNEAQKAYDHREKARFRAVIVPHGA